MNLLQETNDILKKFNKTEQDIKFVTDGNSYCNWDDFISQLESMNGYEYDSSYGQQYVNPHLKIVGDDWYLERSEYDGAEWWEYKQVPIRPDKYNSKIKI